MGSDVTLINMNLMYALLEDSIDFQVYNPLGILHIASSLERHGFSVDFRDYQLFVKQHLKNPFDLKCFSEFVRGSAQIVGFSCMSNLLPFTLLAARRLKEEKPETIVILGGVGPTGVGREIMECFDWIDYVCYGEGEHSMVDLVNKLKSGMHSTSKKCGVVPGIFLRRDGHILFKIRPRIGDLDSIPPPAYHHIDFNQYDAAFSIITSRGCPYSCTFCTETNHWTNGIVFHSINRIIEDIKTISFNSNLRVFLFQDDQITLNRERAKDLFKRLIKEQLGMHWKAFVRVDQVDEELLALMEEAGCIQVRFGVESGSNRILKKIKKGFSIEEAYAAVTLALNYIPSVHATFIWGFPFETFMECKETMDWVERFLDTGCTVLNFLLSPLPNSEIYRKYKGPFDFNENIMPNFNVSGGEKIVLSGTHILKKFRYMFKFIQEYPKIFPGFYLYDYNNNVRPKMSIVHKKRQLVFRRQRKLKLGEYEGVDA